MPALVSTLCICIVFLPMFFLSGVARYLFVPLAEAVVFAMLASYVLSRTLVPTHGDVSAASSRRIGGPPSRNPLVRAQQAFERGFERLPRRLSRAARRCWSPAGCVFVPAFFVACLAAFLLVPWLGQDFFPNTDSGQFILHLRAEDGHPHRGDRASSPTRSRTSSAARFRRGEIANILDNIGLPYSTINFMHTTSGLIGAGDADILVSLSEDHRPTADYVRAAARGSAARSFPASRSTSCPPTS